MNDIERVAIDSAVHHGTPVIRGTRVPVARIIAELAGGMTKEEVAREYDVTSEDVADALRTNYHLHRNR